MRSVSPEGMSASEHIFFCNHNKEIRRTIGFRKVYSLPSLVESNLTDLLALKGQEDLVKQEKPFVSTSHDERGSADSICYVTLMGMTFK